MIFSKKRVSDQLEKQGQKVRQCAIEMVEHDMATTVSGQRIVDDMERAMRKGGSKILIVEDHESLRIMLSMFLLDRGYAVEVAPDGVIAVDMIAENDIGLLITDLNMPNMDGLTLTSLITKPGFPVLIITADPEDPRLQILIETSVAEIRVLGKPFRMTDVYGFVKDNMPIRKSA